MQYQIIPVTPFDQNCTILICPETRFAAIVDPGGDIERIEAALKLQSVRPAKILLTHGHIDHCGAASKLSEKYQIPIEGPHEDERFWLDMLPTQGQQFGFPMVPPLTPNRWLQQGDQVSFGQIELEVRWCPGHTPGHVVFCHHPSKLVLVGDVLFAGSIGRTDFPKGNYDLLVHSIEQHLWSLGDEYTFIPGHGPTSTIGHEKRHNPFVGSHQFG